MVIEVVDEEKNNVSSTTSKLESKRVIQQVSVEIRIEVVEQRFFYCSTTSLRGYQQTKD